MRGGGDIFFILIAPVLMLYLNCSLHCLMPAKLGQGSSSLASMQKQEEGAKAWPHNVWRGKLF
jgi:hypothetical protein